MGIIRDAKAATLGQDALKAFAGASSYYTPVLNFPATWHAMSGGIPDWPPMIDAIEAAGWKLRDWQVATDAKGRPQAFPLFVRANS